MRNCGLKTIVFLFIAFFSSTLSADEVYTKNKAGNDLYKKGKYAEALKQYDEALLIAPSDSLLKMNKGSALFNTGQLQEADSLYQSVLSIKDKKKLAAARYNLGNIQFKEGDMLLKSNGQGANEKYKAALDNYIAALDLSPQDKETKWNLELTQRRIKLAEQQQKQQQQNQDKDQNKKDQNKQNQDKKDQDQNKKDQNKKDQEKKDQEKKDQEKKDQEKKDQQNQNAQDDKKDQQNQKPQPQPKDNKQEMKKAEAKRLIMQFADDADTLNKPPKKEAAIGKMRKPEKDW